MDAGDAAFPCGDDEGGVLGFSERKVLPPISPNVEDSGFMLWVEEKLSIKVVSSSIVLDGEDSGFPIRHEEWSSTEIVFLPIVPNDKDFGFPIKDEERLPIAPNGEER